jgi:hypothetical protein
MLSPFKRYGFVGLYTSFTDNSPSMQEVPENNLYYYGRHKKYDRGKMMRGGLYIQGKLI